MKAIPQRPEILETQHQIQGFGPGSGAIEL